jgi:hypothetical protein
MGSKIEKSIKKRITSLKVGEKVGKAVEKPLRTGASAARRDAAAALKEQKMKESARLAEKESEIATNRALIKSGRGGRQSLIKSSGGGLANNLGGVV